MRGEPPVGTPVSPPRLSVVLPTLDEAARIATRLVELRRLPGIHEVIVVDGGSRDETVAIARAFPEVRVVEAPRGRASQMNAGASVASGDVLLFLHADVSLPVDVTAHVERALADASVVAGAFRTWTVADGGPTRLAPLLHVADLRSRYTGLPYGDQAIFVRARAFGSVGGFPEVPIMEDVELSRRLRRIGRIRTCPANVRVSGRRFLARPFHSALVMNLFPLLARMGVPLRALADAYGVVR